MIRLCNIKKDYGSGDSICHALDGIDLEIQDGEYVAIMGTSGSGKSTLLNIIGCMDTLTSGTYLYDDISVSGMESKEFDNFRNTHISFVFQHFALMKFYSVYENVELPLLAVKMSRKERKEKIMKALSEFGMEEYAGKKVTELSGGQQQRVAIARAYVTENNILLADEPTGALDEENTLRIMDCFDDLHKMGKTIILVTHDRDVAERADRIIELRDGRIVSA